MQYPSSLPSKVLALLGTLTILGFSSIPSAEAKNDLLEPTPKQDATLAIPSVPLAIAQLTTQLTEASSPVYWHNRLTFSVNGTVYQGILKMNGYRGTFRVRFFAPNLGKTEVVDQEMRLKSSSQGLILLGYNPSIATYIPDNFIFAVDPDGTLIAYTCDYLKRCSPVDVQSYK
ncbi:MAG: hypothetical protein WCQ26_06995 [Pseudanabaena sp. ELA748]